MKNTFQKARSYGALFLLAAMVFDGKIANAEPNISAESILLANRIGFGVNKSVADNIARLGPDRWLNEQLHPTKAFDLPTAIDDKIAQMPAFSADMANELDVFKHLNDDQDSQMDGNDDMSKLIKKIDDPILNYYFSKNEDDAKLKSPKKLKNHIKNEILREVSVRRFYRETYARQQLKQSMIWFWDNHFSMFAQKATIPFFIASFEDKAIAPNALGHFRDLLEAVLRSPAMLQYLDNARNKNDHINENYARELMELHTMGVGSGYTQADVEALAHILTGVGVAKPGQEFKLNKAKKPLLVQDGLFVFNPGLHDFSDKTFLGHVIKGRGYAEVTEALDILCHNPKTAEYISTKLIQYFVSDQPAPELVDKMKQKFLDTDGDITALLTFLFQTEEFKQSLSKPLLKDPEHYIVSALRLAFDGIPISNPKPALQWLTKLGQPIFQHGTPDGYSLQRSYWNGPGQIEKRFEIARAIGGGPKKLFQDDTSKDSPDAPDRKDLTEDNVFKAVLSDTSRKAIEQSKSVVEKNTILLSSPEFMGR